MANYLQLVETIFYRSIGATASAVIKAGTSRLASFSCTNLNANTRYFQIHNRATALSGGETPLISYPVYGNSGLLIVGQEYLGEHGLRLSTGLTFSFSTTALTHTAGTATDAIVEVRFV